MKKVLTSYLVCLLAVVLMATTCGDDTGSDDGGDVEGDWSCLAQACVNDDHNTHTDCGCDADYCYPTIGGAEHCNVNELTCTKINCEKGDSSSCPPGYDCLDIPPSIIKYAKDEYGANLPETVCGIKQ